MLCVPPALLPPVCSDLFAMSPRVVVFNANFWDVVRMTKHDRMHMNGFWEVSSPMLASWAANFTTWVNHVRTKLPKVSQRQGPGTGRG